MTPRMLTARLGRITLHWRPHKRAIEDLSPLRGDNPATAAVGAAIEELSGRFIAERRIVASGAIGGVARAPSLSEPDTH